MCLQRDLCLLSCAYTGCAYTGCAYTGYRDVLIGPRIQYTTKRVATVFRSVELGSGFSIRIDPIITLYQSLV